MKGFIIFWIIVGAIELAESSPLRTINNSWTNELGDDFEFSKTWGPGGHINFKVRTEGEVIVCLSSSKTCEEPSRSVMITLGCNNNQMVEICTSIDTKTFISENLLDGSAFVNFTLIWEEGLIALWRVSKYLQDKDKVSKAIGTLRATNAIDVKYFGFKSKSEHGSAWIICALDEPCENDTEVCSTRKIEEYHTTPRTIVKFIPFNDRKEKKVRFEVKAAKEAVFILSSSEFSYTGKYRQIEGDLGMNNNTKTIMYFNAARRREVESVNLLKEHEFVGFWLLWSRGFVALWVDGQNEAVLTKIVPNKFEMYYFGMQTNENHGDWKFHICETASSVLTTTSAPPAPP